MHEILEGIKNAIRAEREAQEQYRMLAEKAVDPKVKSVFAQLMRDEEEHEKILRFRYEAFSKLSQQK
ncbi:MAG: rubrerythrin [Firmicutes bacterium]|jgi:rubrerythrin|nr:rubrerythrin [Bacillota bacterium]